MRDVLHYAVVRFRPLPELSEFANIGVVVFDPSNGQVAYKLAPRRFRRVTQFFDNVDASVYSETIRVVDAELARLSMMSTMRSPDAGKRMFASFVERREGVIAFSAIRAISGGTQEEAIKRLYDRFVRRNLEQLPQREVSMVREIREVLNEAEIYSFKMRQIEDDLMPVRLPLVSELRRSMAVIKPMAFDQRTTIGIIDHANIWRDRFRYLIEKRVLSAENVMIPIERPQVTSDGIMLEAYQLARSRMCELNVRIADYDEGAPLPAQILEFAHQAEGGGRVRLLN